MACSAAIGRSGIFSHGGCLELTQARHEARKRERKARSSLFSQAKQDKKGPKSALGIATTAPQLSKSALRRQKHKQRDQLAGNKQGLQDLAEELTTLQDSEPKSVPVTGPIPGTITSKSKRRMLYVPS